MQRKSNINIMKIQSLFLLSLLPIIALAQTTMQVWANNTATEFDIANIDSIKEGVEVHAAINNYNNRYKAVKVILLGNSIWLSMEQFLYSKEGAFDLFSRIIGVLETVIISFRQEFLAK